MRTESAERPAAYRVERHGDKAEVILCENITEKETGEETAFVYDEYRAVVPWRANLETSVAAAPEEWLTMAKEREAAAGREKSLEEKVAALETENRLTGDAVEDIIRLVMGGDV